MTNSFKRAFSGSIVGLLSRVTEAIVRFITLPILIVYFGKDTYGLIELAISTNAYMQLLDMGMNMGTVKFFSQWLVQGKIKRIVQVSQSNVVFYGIIGLINLIVLLGLSVFAGTIFHIRAQQLEDFKLILLILSITAFVNWAMYTVNQLLLAHENISWIHLMSLVRALTALISAFVTVHFNLGLIAYFWLFTLSSFIYIPLSIFKLKNVNKRINIISYLVPKWHGSNFKEVYKYGFSIFALGIFQFSAGSLRPIFLGLVSSSKGVLTDYRIIQNFVTLILTFGNIFTMSLLPLSAKAVEEKDSKGSSEILITGTRYVTFIISLVLVVISCLSSDILTLYVGKEYIPLSSLLILSCFIVLVQIHLSPIASMFYAVGKTRALIYFTIPNTIISLLIVIVKGAEWGVQATVVSYAFYIIMQMLFYYMYYIPHILKFTSSKIILRGFIPGLITSLLVFILYFYIENLLPFSAVSYLNIIFKASIILFCYLLFSLIFINESERKIILTTLKLSHLATKK